MIGRCLRALLRRPRRLLAVLLLLALIGLGVSVPGMHLWAAYHFRAAEQALQQHHPADARRHLEQCLRVWPRSAPTLLLAARAARQLGDFDGAARHLRACIKARGRDDDLNLELVLLRAQRGETDAVARYLRALVDRGHPASPLILEALAAGYLRAYRLADADYCAMLWTDREPDNHRAYVVRGWVREHWDDREEAADYYRKALRLDPQDDEARSRLASVLLDMHKGSEAVGHVEYLAGRQPGNQQLQVELARCRFLLGRPEEAAELLDRALTADPGLFHALVLRGQLALETGRPGEAASWLRRALALHPGDYQSHYLLHQALLRCGRADEAAKEARQMQAARADVERFQAILKKKMSQTPRDPALHVEVGGILLRAGYPAEGLRWLRSAVQIDPRYRPAHALLADYYEVMGNAGRAQRHRQLAAGQQADGHDSARPAPPGPYLP